MRYRVLGSIEVAGNGQPIAIGRGKPRPLLAALLIDANRGVSVDELIERLWAGEPPLRATKSVQVLVSQLRRALGGEEASIVTVGSGYMLRIQPGDMDIDLFEELLERGRGQLGEGRPRDAEATLDEALAHHVLLLALVDHVMRPIWHSASRAAVNRATRGKSAEQRVPV